MLVPMLTPAPGRRPASTALLAVADNMSEALAAVLAGADLVDLGGAQRPAVAEFRARHPGVGVCVPDEAVDLVRLPAVDLVRRPATAIATGALLICADPGAARASALPSGQLIVEVMPTGVAAAAQAGWAALIDADLAAELAEAERPALIDADLAAELAETGRPALIDVDLAAELAETGRPALIDADLAAELAEAERSALIDVDLAAELAEAERSALIDVDLAAALAGVVAIAALSSWLGAAVVRTRHPLPVRRALKMAAAIQGSRPPARTVRGLA